jgi:hypothetical protein
MNFPLDARFKLLAIASQISVTDAHGTLLYYAKQKAFKLKEAVTVFADQEQTRPLYRIAADRVLDISARYRIEDAGGAEVGVLQRQGMQSFWRAHYDIEQGGRPVFAIREENPWSKVADGILGSIPIISIFSGYFFNPSYLLTPASPKRDSAAAGAPDGPPLLRAVKRQSLLEGRFEIQALTGEQVPDVALVAVLMMLLLERLRG